MSKFTLKLPATRQRMAKKMLLFFTAFLLMIAFKSNAQVLLSEDFSTATGSIPPTGWTNLANGTTTDLWRFDNPGARVITGGTPGFAAPFAIFDSDNTPTTTGEDASLTTAAFDASGAGSYRLEFDNQVRFINPQTCEVDVWNGTAWVNAVSYSTASIGYSNPAVHSVIDITTQTGGFNASMVRFRFAGNDRWWWAIDNITITRVNCSAPAATFTVVPDCANNQFSVNVNITSMGTATSIDINDGPTLLSTATALGNYVVGPFLSGTAHTLTLVNNLNALCNLTSPVQASSCPPANDDCINAFMVTVNPALTCVAVTSGTVVNASASVGPTSSCGTYDDDVWFKFVAASTTQIITLQNVAGSTTDLTFQVLSGCGASAALVCSDPNTATISSLTIGNTYYIRVATYTATIGQTTTFDVCVTTPPPMSYVSSTTTQSTTTSVAAGSLDNQIIGVQIVVLGASVALNVTNINFTTNGTTSASDITKAKVYYTGNSSTFSTITPFGTAFVNPNGSFSVTGSQSLIGAATGNATNYFWLVYDLACNATAANVLDAECTSVDLGSNYIPTITTPTGTRTITAISALNAIVNNGNWNDPATWACGSVPTCTDLVNIPNGINVIVNGAASNCKTVTIATGGKLTVSGSSLTIGCTLKNNKLTNNGTLTVTAGTLNINGNVVFATGSTFNQSGGDIIIDGNDGIASANSVGSGTAMLLISSGLGTVTGGTITIVNPNFNSSGKALDYNVSSTPMVWAVPHTLQLGDGVSTTTTANTNGFIIEQYTGTGKLLLGNLTVKGGNATNRWGSLGAWSTFVSGTLTVDAGSEMRLNSTSTSPVLSGNIINQGTLTSTVAVIFGGTNGNTTVANTAAQSIGGAGLFRNAITTPTANFNGLTVNTSAPLGVTLNVPVQISGTLTLTNGAINTTATNLLTVGVSPSAIGTVSRTLGWVSGPLKRWYAAATNGFGVSAAYLPVGKPSVAYPAEISFSTAPSTGGTLTAEYIVGNPGNTGLPQTEATYTAVDVYGDGFWKIENDGITGGTYAIKLTGTDFASLQLWTSTGDARIIKRNSGSGTWGTFEGTHVNGTSYTVQRSGLTGFSEFAITKSNVALPISLVYFNAVKGSNGNSLNWKVNCTSVSVAFEIERSSNGRNFSSIGKIAASQARCQAPFDFADSKSLAGVNYYRIKIIDVDGKISYSNTVAIVNKVSGIALIGMQPTLVRNEAILYVAAAKAGKLQLVVTDMVGRRAQMRTINVVEGDNKISLNLGTLATGVYNITNMDENKKSTIRFVKQ